MPDLPSIPRRQALATAGIAATSVGGYVAGVRTVDAVPDWFVGRDCSPSSLATSATDWPFAKHDRANTGHAPDRAGPDWPLTQVWEVEWPIPYTVVVVWIVTCFCLRSGCVLAILQMMIPDSRLE